MKRPISFLETRRAVLRALGAGMGGLALAGTARAQTTPGVTDTEIKLGTWMPLSGPMSTYGVPLRAGIETCIKLLNDRGGIKGRKLSLVAEDSVYNAQRTVAIAKKLVTRDNIFALVTPFGTAQSAAAFDYLFDEQSVPYLNPYGGQADWYTPPRRNLYGALVLYEHQARALGRWAAKDGQHKVLVMHSVGSGFHTSALGVEPGVKSVKPDATVELYPVKYSTTDYGPIALDLIKKSPDAIVLIQVEAEVVAAAKQLRDQGYKGHLYSYAAAVANSLIALGGKAVEGLRSTSFTLPVTSDVPAVKEYRDALAKYSPGDTPDYISMIGFALMKINAEAIKRIEGPITRTALLESMDRMKAFDSGIIPPVSYSPERHQGATLLQRVVVKDGKWVTVGSQIESDKDW
jgi:branched-chain amino acid transport system substrate-binding protein